MAELIAGGAYGGADANQFGQGEEGEGEEEEDGGRKAGYRGRTWSDKEDVLLPESWMAVSMNGTTSANQKRDAYWLHIHKDYTE